MVTCESGPSLQVKQTALLHAGRGGCGDAQECIRSADTPGMNMRNNNLYIYFRAEECRSGRSGRSRKAIGLNGPREFESHLLRFGGLAHNESLPHRMMGLPSPPVRKL